MIVTIAMLHEEVASLRVTVQRGVQERLSPRRRPSASPPIRDCNKVSRLQVPVPARCANRRPGPRFLRGHSLPSPVKLLRACFPAWIG